MTRRSTTALLALLTLGCFGGREPMPPGQLAFTVLEPRGNREPILAALEEHRHVFDPCIEQMDGSELDHRSSCLLFGRRGQDGRARLRTSHCGLAFLGASQCLENAARRVQFPPPQGTDRNSAALQIRLSWRAEGAPPARR